MKSGPKTLPNQRLREERELRGWSQQYVAMQIGAERYYLSRWERGVVSPSAYYRRQLCALFGKTAQELGLLADKSGPQLSSQKSESLSPPESPARQILWNISHERNPFFTGREAVFELLHEKLSYSASSGMGLPLALSGLGGIGKTQTVIEYAYRYRAAYQAVFWITADTHEVLLADCSATSHMLQVPEKDQPDQYSPIAVLRRWLSENNGWLLIFDNVEDIDVIRQVIPAEHTGRVLLTTRTQVTGPFAVQLHLEKMTPEEGAVFLLRRTKLIAPGAPLDAASQAEQTSARELARMMDGLPLALDQAAAYIEETACGMPGYRQRYQVHRARLLSVRGTAPDHPASVATTLSLSFQKIQQANEAAAELLRFCAFLHPDAIPEELLIDGASELGPHLQAVAANVLSLDAIIKELRTFSLIQRHPDTATVTLHRLVQSVVKDEMAEGERALWVDRMIRAVERAFPDVAFASWQRCQRLLPQALECLALIKQGYPPPVQAVRLFQQAGAYLQEQAQYAQAELLYAQALAIGERLLEPLHPDIAQSLHNLAMVYNEQNKYDAAVPLLLRALAICEQTLGPEHPESAKNLMSLAMVYDNQGAFEQAEPLYHQALEIYQRVVDPMHPDIATCLNNLGWLYLAQGRYFQAEPLYLQSLSIRKRILEPQHPQVATSLNLLGWLYFALGKYARAEPFLQEALAIRQQQLGPNHPDVAGTLNHLADLYRVQGNYTQAELLYRQALTIREQALGGEHRDVAQSLNNLGRLYADQKMDEQAEALYQQALAIRERTLGSNHTSIAISLNDLAELYYALHSYEQAEACNKRALEILRTTVGYQHPHMAINLHMQANLACLQGRYDAAEPLYSQALAIREQALGLEHPDLVKNLEDYASMLRRVNRNAQATTLEQRAQKICTEQASEVSAAFLI